MQVLVINCGSSSLKFRLCRVPSAAADASAVVRLAGGEVRGIGRDGEIVLQGEGSAAQETQEDVPDHAAAARIALEGLRRMAGDRADGGGIDAVGHRVVHGGADLHAPARIDADVRRTLAELNALAPLHNGSALAGLDAVQAELGGDVPQVAVFDTAFHHDLPAVARQYALPHELAARHGIRRFGFHGTSCRSVLRQYGALAGAGPRGRIVILHLGSGSSATAVLDGRSVDTSMGFSPLEGLVMGTRSGDLDPALPAFIARREGLAPDAVEHLLNTQSGLLGVSGLSNDLRVLLAQEQQDERARLAVALFCYRVRKYVGAYTAALEGLDALMFTGGIGEHLPEVRRRICDPLAWAGVRLDARRNEEAVGGQAVSIGAQGAPVSVSVIPSDEERQIAWDTASLLT